MGMLTLCLIALTSQADNKQNIKGKQETVDNLNYGLALFDYFQNKPFDALSQLAIARQTDNSQQNSSPQNSNKAADLMFAGVSLAYGMPDSAEQQFHSLLSEDTPAVTRDTAWFYLAKLRYQQNDDYGARGALSRLSDKPPQQIQEKSRFLALSLNLKNSDLQQAEQQVTRIHKDQWAAYGQFNLASKLSRQGRYSQAERHYQSAFQTLAKRQERNREDLALMDQIATSRGFNFLFNQEPGRALKQFKSVQLHGIHADTAILGYGRALVALQDPLQATAAWQELARRSYLSPSAQRALLELPASLAKDSHLSESLYIYEQVEHLLINQQDHIDSLRVNTQWAMAAPDNLTTMTEPGLRTGLGPRLGPRLGRAQWADQWITSTDSDIAFNTRNLLSPLFSRNRFQAQLISLEDIHDLIRRTHAWQDKLTHYQQALELRRQQRQAGAKHYQRLGVTQTFDDLQNRQSRLRTKIDTAKADKQYLQFLSKHQREIQQRLNHAKRRRDLLADGSHQEHDPAHTAQIDERLRRYEGLLLWEASRDFSSRLADVELQWQQQASALSGLERANRRSEQLISNTGADHTSDIEQAQQRLDQLSVRLNNAENQLVAAAQQLHGDIAGQIARELGKQQKQLNQHLIHTRLAIAQIHDRANMEARR